MEHSTDFFIYNPQSIAGIVVWLIVFFLVYRLIVQFLGNRSRLESLRIQQETERFVRQKKIENEKHENDLNLLKVLADSTSRNLNDTLKSEVQSQDSLNKLAKLYRKRLKKIYKLIMKKTNDNSINDSDENAGKSAVENTGGNTG